MHKKLELQVQQLTKIYENKGLFVKKKNKTTKCALDDVSFLLTKGLYGILGPNGAGKSTLINIITDSILPTSGKVFWNRKNAHNLGVAYRRILGYMPQQQSLYDTFSGMQFLLYIAALKEISASSAKEEVIRVASLVHLEGELEKRLGAYSGGMKQRILAASAMLGKPRLLIFDEPTAGLDPKERVHLRKLLAQLATKSIVIVATHVVSDVESVAHQILLLKDGKLVAKDSPKALVDKYAPGADLESVYLSVFGEDEI